MTRHDVVAVQLMLRALPERQLILPGELEVLVEIDDWCTARADLVDAAHVTAQPMLGAAGPRP